MHLIMGALFRLTLLLLFSPSVLEQVLTLPLLTARHFAEEWVVKHVHEDFDDWPQQFGVATEVVTAAWEMDVPAEQALKIAWRESRFYRNKTHVNAPGFGVDYGPMQVNDVWTPEVRYQTESERIRTGVRLLKRFYVQCQRDWGCAHKAYATGTVSR